MLVATVDQQYHGRVWHAGDALDDMPEMVREVALRNGLAHEKQPVKPARKRPTD